MSVIARPVRAVIGIPADPPEALLDLRVDSRQRNAQPNLIAIGCAVPELFSDQQSAATEMAELWGLSGSALLRWKRIVDGSGVEQRHAVMAMSESARLTTQERMVAYERLAPSLAARAARQALDGAGLDASEITDLIVVSCTGFSAPGVDVALLRELGMQSSVRRIVVGFMGCFGAISGLRTAVGACSADPSGAALVVCVELCSLHLRTSSDVENQIASALFADGAAAAVVVGAERAQHRGDRAIAPGEAPRSIGRLDLGASMLISEGAEWMTWRITDHGFAMTLTREVPNAVRARIAEFVDGASPRRPATYIVHPGGPGIIDAVDEGLALQGGAGLDAAREVLRRYGNMSSGTVLFVLGEALRRGAPLSALLMAFGPGLSIEGISISEA